MVKEPSSNTVEETDGIASNDLDEFVRRLKEMGTEFRRSAGPEDIAHLVMVERSGRGMAVAGWLTAGLRVNPVSVALLAGGQMSQWLLMHHISHKAYDNVEGVPRRFTSVVFGRGSRRPIDWLDWISPSAWHIEHDHAHHYHLGEDEDPDLLERNATRLINSDLDPRLKRAAFVSFAAVWKWAYYAPKTIGVERRRRDRKPTLDLPRNLVLLDPRTPVGRETWKRSILLNFGVRFVLVPAVFALAGKRVALRVLVNSLLAEVVANYHAFAVITPSHTAPDLYRFDGPGEGRGEFLLRQIVGTANYSTGTEWLDRSQMWLNYQIEHHVWPDLTMLKYREAQPRLEALCREFNVPYHQESLWGRVKKMFEVLEGRAVMKRADRAIDVVGMARRKKSGRSKTLHILAHHGRRPEGAEVFPL